MLWEEGRSEAMRFKKLLGVSEYLRKKISEKPI